MAKKKAKRRPSGDGISIGKVDKLGIIEASKHVMGMMQCPDVGDDVKIEALRTFRSIAEPDVSNIVISHCTIEN